MSDQLEYMDFPRNSLYICHVLDSVLLKNFHSNFFTCEEVFAQLDFAKSTLTN
jgi:hypothetical protein